MMGRWWLSLALVGIASWPPAARAEGCPDLFAGGQPPRLLKGPMADRTTMLCNRSYASLASGVTHGALWSAEHLTTDSLEAARGLARVGQFHPDARLPEEDRSQTWDYTRSGYDRGHMTPSGDAPDGDAQQETFSLANVVPQTPELNRGVWEGIEAAVRHLATTTGELYVVTGPAFRSRSLQSIGPDRVLVPTATWKAVYDPTAGAAGAYLCTNTAEPACSTMSIDELSRQTGVEPFPAIEPQAREVQMALPDPEESPYAYRSQGAHPGWSLLKDLLEGQ